MLRNYFTIGWRAIRKNSVYSIINIAGLAFGLATAIVIWLWVQDEVSFNKSFKNFDRLVQLYHHVTFGSEVMTINDVPAPIAEELRNSIIGFDQVCLTGWPAEQIVRYNETTLTETALFIEPKFLETFSVNLARQVGDPLDDIIR